MFTSFYSKIAIAKNDRFSFLILIEMRVGLRAYLGLISEGDKVKKYIKFGLKGDKILFFAKKYQFFKKIK